MHNWFEGGVSFTSTTAEIFYLCNVPCFLLPSSVPSSAQLDWVSLIIISLLYFLLYALTFFQQGFGFFLGFWFIKYATLSSLHLWVLNITDFLITIEGFILVIHIYGESPKQLDILKFSFLSGCTHSLLTNNVRKLFLCLW